MTSGIYCITNKTNGHRYIGSSANMFGRWKRHEKMLQKGTHHSAHLQRAWIKYGADNFKFSVIAVCDEQVLLIYEQMFIDGLHPEYNISPTAQSTTGVIRSEEYRAKQSVAQSGKTLSPETRKKISDGMKGKKNSAGIKRTVSQETRDKIRASLTGHAVSPDTREKIGAKNRNNRHTDEAKRKISQSLIGNKRASGNA